MLRLVLLPEFPELSVQEIFIPFFLVSKIREFLFEWKVPFPLCLPFAQTVDQTLSTCKWYTTSVNCPSRNRHPEKFRGFQGTHIRDEATRIAPFPILNAPTLSLKKNNELGLLSKLKTGSHQ